MPPRRGRRGCSGVDNHSISISISILSCILLVRKLLSAFLLRCHRRPFRTTHPSHGRSHPCRSFQIYTARLPSLFAPCLPLRRLSSDSDRALFVCLTSLQSEVTRLVDCSVCDQVPQATPIALRTAFVPRAASKYKIDTACKRRARHHHSSDLR
jgi:hypothetical protein